MRKPGPDNSRMGSRRPIALLRQVIRFGLVGIAATATHAGVAVALVEAVSLPFLWANALAYGCAVGVSYGGHRVWTFDSRGAHRVQLPRFVAVSLGGLALAQAIGWAVHNALGLPYGVALACVVVGVPTATFAAHRFWVFGGGVNGAERADAPP